jgi:xanthine dehydrogenase accessory factor
MLHSLLNQFLSKQNEHFVIILGTNEIASAIAARLTGEGSLVVLSHDPYPPVIRRGMAFHDALFDDRAEVDGVHGRRAETAMEIIQVLSEPCRVAVTSLTLTDLITIRMPDVLIDARMQKYRPTPILRGISKLSIGLGPNFTANVNCDIAIETHPAHAGELLESGSTSPPDGVPRFLGGVGKGRFVYTACDGIWRTPYDTGSRVFKGVEIGRLDRLPVVAPRDGVLRGIVRDGTFVPRDTKLIEIDPRGRFSDWSGADERSRTIAEATAKAISAASSRRRRIAPAKLTHH